VAGGHVHDDPATVLRGDMTEPDAVQATARRTRNLARRQLAWFRRDPRIRWFDAGEDGASEVVDEVLGYLESNG